MNPDSGTWRRWPSPKDAGWSEQGLATARSASASIDTAAVLIIAGGQVVDAWGSIDVRYNLHSIRKSLLSALLGLAVEDGILDLEAMLSTLDIDDHLGLSAREKLATVLDLLTSRSGIYHPTCYESPAMVALKPRRGSVGPGTTWCYKNLDFNVLGTIYRRATGADIFTSFQKRIAIACGMQDFRPDLDGEYVSDPDTAHPAYPFRMTARDLARFGELYLRGGICEGRQVVPADWIASSVLPYSNAGTLGAYGFMWWASRSGILFPGVIVPDGTFAGWGSGGHFVVVIPRLDTVVVHRVDTDVPTNDVSPPGLRDCCA